MNKYVISYSYMESFYQGTSRYNTLVVDNCIHEAESMTETEFYKLKKKLSKPWEWRNTDKERNVTILSWQKLDEEVNADGDSN